MPDKSAYMIYLDVADDDMAGFIGQILDFAGLNRTETVSDSHLCIVDPLAARNLENGRNAVVISDEDDGYSASDSQIVVTCPLRAGSILGLLRRLLTGQAPDHPAELLIGPYVFFPALMLLESGAANGTIKLTEKERDLLLFLYQRQGQTISRADILQTLWGYAENVETHTLETHFYRLRQKIEADPSKPSLLVTSDDGYCLKL